MVPLSDRHTAVADKHGKSRNVSEFDFLSKMRLKGEYQKQKVRYYHDKIQLFFLKSHFCILIKSAKTINSQNFSLSTDRDYIIHYNQ